jgi:hypothetical protein
MQLVPHHGNSIASSGVYSFEWGVVSIDTAPLVVGHEEERETVKREAGEILHVGSRTGQGRQADVAGGCVLASYSRCKSRRYAGIHASKLMRSEC